MLALDTRNVAVGSIGEVAPHDNHLRIVDDIAGEQTMWCSRAWLIRVPFDPFESRHCEYIYIIEPLGNYSPCDDSGGDGAYRHILTEPEPPIDVAAR